MANLKWGSKRTCLSCGKPFYDMRRTPIVCPSCEAPFEVSPPARIRRPRAAVARAPTPPVEPLAETPPEAIDESSKSAENATEGAEDIAPAEEKDAETIEDPAELGEDEDDVAEVVDGMEKSDKADV